MIGSNNRKGLEVRRLIRLILNQLYHPVVKKLAILCCQEGHCSAGIFGVVLFVCLWGVFWKYFRILR